MMERGKLRRKKRGERREEVVGRGQAAQQQRALPNPKQEICFIYCCKLTFFLLMSILPTISHIQKGLKATGSESCMTFCRDPTFEYCSIQENMLTICWKLHTKSEMSCEVTM